MKDMLRISENKNIIRGDKMKVRKLYELINNYITNLNAKIIFYDSNDNELELADIDGDDDIALVIFRQKSNTAEVE